jgi:hypothetical protein
MGVTEKIEEMREMGGTRKTEGVMGIGEIGEKAGGLIELKQKQKFGQNS